MDSIESEVKIDRVGDWMQTYTNQEFWPLDPKPEEVFIEDIAHALALTNRFGGHTKWPYSVAQHSILCAEQVSDPFKLEALMHDATEAYMCDLPRPLKYQLSNYRAYEKNLWIDAIAPKFNLRNEKSLVVSAVDLNMLYTEAKQLMPSHSWHEKYGSYVLDIQIEQWDWDTAESNFLMAYYRYKDL